MPLLDEILVWSQKSLKPWQQDAARRLFQQTLDADALDDLYAMLKDGFGIPDPQQRKPEPLGKDHLPVSAAKLDSVKLLSMEKLENVNRLAPGQVLQFAPSGLTVIYGGNGAGKSGYARVLKRACRSRDAFEHVRPNALLKPAQQGVPKCVFSIETGGATQTLEWMRGKTPPSELATIAVFDTHCARAFLDQDQDIAYLPFGLDVVEDLAQVVLPKLTEKLTAELGGISISVDAFKHLAGPSAVGSLIAKLSILTTDAEVEKLAVVSEDEAAEYNALRKTLSETDLAARIKALQLTIGRMNDLRKRITNTAAWVKNEAIERFKTMDVETETAKKVADDAATVLRSGEDLLPGTGDQVWKSLFLAAKSYSISAAYVGKDFPHVHDDARCVLCQQLLSGDGAGRLTRFEEFIQHDVAKTAAEKLNERAAAVLKIQNANIGIVIDDAAADELEHLAPGLLSQIKEFDAAIESRRAWMLSCQLTHLWEEPTDLPVDPRVRLAEIVDNLTAQVVKFEKAANDEERVKLERQAAEFKARLGLAPLRQELLDLLSRMRMRALLAKCKDQLQTKFISDKAKELASSTVTAPLRAALKEEFQRLGVAPAAPQLDERVKRGKLSHKLELPLQSTAAIRDILSEGEQRAIAIGSFLAELRVGGHGGGIVFDDPVDLPPPSRTSVMAAKSVNLENDGHEKEQIYRGADHRFHQAGRGRFADQGSVPQRRLQRRDLLQMACQVRWDGRARRPAAA